MIEGFMTAFVLGFLGTAFPRLTETKPLSRFEFGGLILLLVTAVGLHIGHQDMLGDGAFLLLLLLFCSALGIRFFHRKDVPPPSFVLVAIGLLNAIAGTVLLIIGSTVISDGRWPALGLLLLYQGFVLNLILGVGAFLLPRFLGIQDTRQRSWANHPLFAAMIGVALLGGFAIEVFALMQKLAGLVRFSAAAVFLFASVPFQRTASGSATIPQVLRAGVVLLLLGLLFPVVWPMHRVAGLHLLFIGGFTIIALSVATRVVLGHSGKGRIVSEPLPYLWGIAALLVIATVLRIIGDFQFIIRGRLLDVASYCWMLAAVIWSWRVLPNVRIPDMDESDS